MDYKIIVLDLDGTLTNRDKIITPRTKEALMKNFIINLLDLKQEEVENIETVRNSTTNIVICTS